MITMPFHTFFETYPKAIDMMTKRFGREFVLMFLADSRYIVKFRPDLKKIEIGYSDDVWTNDK